MTTPVHADAGHLCEREELPGPVGRILGLDVGDRRIGVAISDPSGRLAIPIRIVQRRDDGSDVDTLRAIVAEENVDKLVVGYPLSLSGQAGTQAYSVRRFARRIADACGVKVALQDERLTSVQAAATSRAGGSRNAKGRRKMRRTDDSAAAIILQTYLDRERGSATAGS